MFGLIKNLVSRIGVHVKATLGDDLRHITVVVETTRKLFPAHCQFKVKGSKVAIVFFEYEEGRNLRCRYCFSYRHLPSDCPQPHPSFFSAPDLLIDAALEAPPPISAGPVPHPEGRNLDRTRGPAPARRAGGSRDGDTSSGDNTKQKSKRNRPRNRIKTSSTHTSKESLPSSSAGHPGPDTPAQTNVSGPQTILESPAAGGLVSGNNIASSSRGPGSFAPGLVTNAQLVDVPIWEQFSLCWWRGASPC